MPRKHRTPGVLRLALAVPAVLLMVGCAQGNGDAGVTRTDTLENLSSVTADSLKDRTGIRPDVVDCGSGPIEISNGTVVRCDLKIQVTDEPFAADVELLDVTDTSFDVLVNVVGAE